MMQRKKITETRLPTSPETFSPVITDIKISGYQNIKKLIYPLLYQIFQVIPVTIPDNEIKNKE